MPKTTTPLLMEDFYRTTLTADLNPTWDIELNVTNPPANTKGFIIVDPESEANREKMYYHDVIGNIIYVKGVGRTDPKQHFALDKVQINDTSLIFNYLSKLNSTTFFVEQLDVLDIKVFWWPVLNWITTVSVVDTLLTVVDWATNYIYYKATTNTIHTATSEATVTTNKWIIVADIVTASWAIVSIDYRKNWLIIWSYIDTITLTGTVGLVDTYTILYTDWTSSTFDITNWKGINSIAKTNTTSLVDTYTITYNNATTSTYIVTNWTSFLSWAVAPTTQWVNWDAYLDTVAWLTYLKTAWTWSLDWWDLTWPTWNGIDDITRTTWDWSPWTMDTYTITFTDATTTTYDVWNWVNWTWQVNSIQWSTNISIDNTDSTSPIINTTWLVTKTWTETLTNKTLTSPVVNSPTW